MCFTCGQNHFTYQGSYTLYIATVIKFLATYVYIFLLFVLIFLLDFIIVTINLIQLLAAILIRINYLSIYLSIYNVLFQHPIQACHQDFKLSGKYMYNKQAGNQRARDFFWFYFSLYFPMKLARICVQNSRGKSLAPSSD